MKHYMKYYMKPRYVVLFALLIVLPGCRGCNPFEPDVEPTPTAVPTSIPTVAATPTPASTPVPTATFTATATAIPTPVATVAVTPTDGLHTIRYHCMSDAAFNYVHYQYPNGETHDLNIGASHEWTLTFQFTRSGAPVYPPNLYCEINIDYSKVPFGNYTIIAEIYVDDVFVAVMYDTSHARATFAY
jgi:hypothetical protein